MEPPTPPVHRLRRIPHWSPDVTWSRSSAATMGWRPLRDPETGPKELAPPDPSLEVHCGEWSSDGRRVACESFGWTTRGATASTRSTSDGGPHEDHIEPWRRRRSRRLLTGRPAPRVHPEPSEWRGGAVRGRSRRHRPSPAVPAGVLVDHRSFAGSWSPNGDEILLSLAPRRPHSPRSGRNATAAAASAHDRIRLWRSGLQSTLDSLSLSGVVAGWNEDCPRPPRGWGRTGEHLQRER